MIESSMGYLFYGRSSGDADFGLLCSYKCNKGVNGDMYAVLTYVIGTDGIPCIPVISTVSTGFSPISNVYDNSEEISGFLKGRKPVFGKFGDFAMVINGTAVKKKDGSLDLSRLEIFIPRGIVTDYEGEVDANGNYYPCLLCDRLSNVQGLNTFVVSQQLLSAYKEKFVQYVGEDVLFSDRFTFFKRLANV